MVLFLFVVYNYRSLSMDVSLNYMNNEEIIIKHEYFSSFHKIVPNVEILMKRYKNP